jgi:hypothetical protein
MDVPRDAFLVGGQAWQECRTGGRNLDRIATSAAGLTGLWEVQGNVIRDLAALNRVEALPGTSGASSRSTTTNWTPPTSHCSTTSLPSAPAADPRSKPPPPTAANPASRPRPHSPAPTNPGSSLQARHLPPRILRKQHRPQPKQHPYGKAVRSARRRRCRAPRRGGAGPTEPGATVPNAQEGHHGDGCRKRRGPPTAQRGTSTGSGRRAG